jgi:hypothetical protein
LLPFGSIYYLIFSLLFVSLFTSYYFTFNLLVPASINLILIFTPSLLYKLCSIVTITNINNDLPLVIYNSTSSLQKRQNTLTIYYPSELWLEHLIKYYLDILLGLRYNFLIDPVCALDPIEWITSIYKYTADNIAEQFIAVTSIYKYTTDNIAEQLIALIANKATGAY